MGEIGAKRFGVKALVGFLTVSLVLPLVIGAVPARAQGLFDFLRGLSQPVPAAPVPQPVDAQSNSFEDQPRRKGPTQSRPAPVEVLQVKTPVEARHPGEMDNPFPTLLADSTLRPGDMVMFPDGLRVFTGRVGSRHKVSDFTPLAQAGKAVSRETRKLVSQLHPGENVAWSADAVLARGKLANITKDLATTGSVKRPANGKEPRKR